jgi:hypothetical protein
MHQVKDARPHAVDEELIAVLSAISIMAMRLARKLTKLLMQSQSTEGGKSDEQNKRHIHVHRRPTKMRYHY